MTVRMPDYTAMTAEDLNAALEDANARSAAIIAEMTRRMSVPMGKVSA